MLVSFEEPKTPLVGLSDEHVARRLIIHILVEMCSPEMWKVMEGYCFLGTNKT